MLSPNQPLSYLVLGYRSWNREIYDQVISRLPGIWHYLSSPKELCSEWIERIKPRYLFFLHWSWKVPKEITDRYECVCFHIGDVPAERGGSPLQNLIWRGQTETYFTALRMIQEIDAGPIYYKRPLSLEGRAEEIYRRTMPLAARMIQDIIYHNPRPKQQTGKSCLFKRRKPEESKIPPDLSVAKFYDFIRMLDAPGYPRAFLNYHDFRLEFTQPSLQDGQLKAYVTIVPQTEKK